MMRNLPRALLGMDSIAFAFAQIDIVSRVFVEKNKRQASKPSQRKGSPQFTVDVFEAVRASTDFK
jgi:hypothetical protein